MMSRHSCTLHLLGFLSCVVLGVIAIDTMDFFGEQTPLTRSLVANDDDSSDEITLSVPYPFFDKPMTQLYVSPDLRSYRQTFCMCVEPQIRKLKNNSVQATIGRPALSHSLCVLVIGLTRLRSCSATL